MADRDDVDSTEESRASATNPMPTNGSRAFDPSDSLSGDESSNLSHVDSSDTDFLNVDSFDDDPVDPDAVDPEPLDSEFVNSELVAARSETTKSAAGRSGATSVARIRKEKATPKQKQLGEAPARTGPVTFVKESAAELRKVVYPTGQQLVNYFVVVLIFVLFIIGIVSLLDLAFGAAIIRIFS